MSRRNSKTNNFTHVGINSNVVSDQESQNGVRIDDVGGGTYSMGFAEAPRVNPYEAPADTSRITIDGSDWFGVSVAPSELPAPTISLILGDD